MNNKLFDSHLFSDKFLKEFRKDWVEFYRYTQDDVESSERTLVEWMKKYESWAKNKE